MGKAMGLNPAILLLSLSVWGTLLGFIGLIIALPLTTILIAYYQRYITKEGHEKVQNEEKLKKLKIIWQFKKKAVLLHSLYKTNG